MGKTSLNRLYVNVIFFDMKKLWLEGQFKEIKDKLHMFVASGLAETLRPLFTSAVTNDGNQSFIATNTALVYHMQPLQ